MNDVLKTLDMCRQLANICSDWNLYEVEIDGEMMDIYEIKQIIADTIKSLDAASDSN